MQLASLAASDGKVTVNDFNDMSLDEGGSNFAVIGCHTWFVGCLPEYRGKRKRGKRLEHFVFEALTP